MAFTDLKKNIDSLVSNINKYDPDKENIKMFSNDSNNKKIFDNIDLNDCNYLIQSYDFLFKYINSELDIKSSSKFSDSKLLELHKLKEHIYKSLSKLNDDISNFLKNKVFDISKYLINHKNENDLIILYNYIINDFPSCNSIIIDILEYANIELSQIYNTELYNIIYHLIIYNIKLYTFINSSKDLIKISNIFTNTNSNYKFIEKK